MGTFCVDIDNCIAQTDKIIRQVISDATDGRVQLEYKDVVTFNYFECADKNGNKITKDEWKYVHDRFSEPKVLMSVEPMPGVIDALRTLTKYGTVHLATSRLRKARKTTVEWLDFHSFPDHDLHFLKHGEKHAVLKDFTAAIGEDDYEQAVAFATIGKTPCILLRHPWNRDGAAVEDLQWAENWSEITELLSGLTNRRERL